MRRHSLLGLSAGLLALTGAVTWRAVSVRDALFDRVERRLAGTAELTRESVALWLHERRAGALAFLSALDAATRAVMTHAHGPHAGDHASDIDNTPVLDAAMAGVG